MSHQENPMGAVPLNKIRKIIHDSIGKDLTSLELSPDKRLFHLIYHAKVDDIIKEKGLAKAYPVSIQFMDKDRDGKHMAYEIRLDNQNFEHVYNEKTYGTFVEEQVQIAEAMKGHKELDNLEHAFLRIVTMKVKAIWFRATTRDKDYFVPQTPAFYGLVAGKLYTAGEFIPILTAAADQVYQLMSGSSADDLLGG